MENQLELLENVNGKKKKTALSREPQGGELVTGAR